MLLIRPGNCDQCIKMINTAVDHSRIVLEPNTLHFQLWAGSAALMESNWTEKIIRPLYEKNLLVQIGFNSLVPSFVKLLTEPAAFNKSVESKYFDEFETLAVQLHESCNIHIKRTQTENISKQMISMREVLVTFYTNKDTYTGLKLLYSSSSQARTVWKVMIPRLCKSLEEDLDITESSDIPVDIKALR